MMETKTGAIIGLVTGILLVVGSVSTWITGSMSVLGQSIEVSISGIGSVSAAGLTYTPQTGAAMDGTFILLFGIAIAILSGLALKFKPKGLGIAATAVSALAALILIIDTVNINSKISTLVQQGFTNAQIGWGLYLSLFAAIGAVIGCGMLTYAAFKQGATIQPVKATRRKK